MSGGVARIILHCSPASGGAWWVLYDETAIHTSRKYEHGLRSYLAGSEHSPERPVLRNLRTPRIWRPAPAALRCARQRPDPVYGGFQSTVASHRFVPDHSAGHEISLSCLPREDDPLTSSKCPLAPMRFRSCHKTDRFSSAHVERVALGIRARAPIRREGEPTTPSNLRWLPTVSCPTTVLIHESSLSSTGRSR